MAQRKFSRLIRRVLLAAVLPTAVLLLLSACGGADTTRNAQPETQVNAGDLSGLDVDVHQAVG